jgi:hypothetical protein
MTNFFTENINLKNYCKQLQQLLRNSALSFRSTLLRYSSHRFVTGEPAASLPTLSVKHHFCRREETLN